MHGSDETYLQLSHQYLVFCHYNSYLKSYSVIKHYGLTNGQVVAVDGIDVVNARHGRPTYAGHPTSELLQDLDLALSNQN